MSLAYVRFIKDMYDGGRTSVRTSGWVTNDFPLVMGDQGSAITPLLFTFVMDKFTKEIHDELP